jgi:error-prone DNA polymerase
VGKALALPAAELDRLAKLGDGHTGVRMELERLSDFSHYGENPLWAHLCDLSEQLRGMPRHVSQHCGGLVISSRPLIEIVPVEQSAMPGRQVCQWDKDSVDAARMIKIDFLSLGMLSAVEECLELIVANEQEPLDLSRIDFERKEVYDRICRGETIGAFQIESRAQIGMLVRTQPRSMEDLAIEVAIVRPGPVVANAVNPYVLQREKQRSGLPYQPTFDDDCLKDVLADTLGIIIYQDQTMEVCKAMAGFTDGQADQLRRALSRKRSREHVEKFRELFMEGAAARGVPPHKAHRVFEKVAAFSEFGFPKSHAAAFAVLCFQSMWLLHYYPAEFLASLLNNQPMGFYGPDTLIKDAQRRGVTVLPPDLNESAPGCTVSGKSVRLGLAMIKGVGKAHATRLYAELEENGPYHSLSDVIRRARPTERVVESLILAGALDGFGLNRRELLWQLGLLLPQRGHQNIQRTEDGPRVVGYQPTLALPVEQDQVALPEASRWEQMAHSYRLLSLSVEHHPIELLRPLCPRQAVTAARLRRCPDGQVVKVVGLVTTRQRPQTARGILFLLLEDETGMVNVVVRPELYEAHRELFRTEPLLMIRGVLERRDLRLNLLAQEAWPLTEFLPDAVKSAAARRAATAMRDFTPPPSHNYR